MGMMGPPSPGSQQPLPSAAPIAATVGGGAMIPPPGPTMAMTPPAGPARTAITSTVPDHGARWRGWYPRWWLLSAVCCSLLIGMIAVTLPYFCSGNAASVPIFCALTSWTGWQQSFIVDSIWLLFALGWLLWYVYGTVHIEVDRQSRSFVAHVLRAISEFETTYRLLYITAGLAFVIILFMWYFSRFQLGAFAICSLLIFVAQCCFIYRIPRDERRIWLFGFIVFSIACIAIMFLKKPAQVQPSILTGEALLVLTAIPSLVSRRTNAQANNPTNSPTQTLAAARMPTAIRVLTTLLRLPFRRP